MNLFQLIHTSLALSIMTKTHFDKNSLGPRPGQGGFEEAKLPSLKLPRIIDARTQTSTYLHKIL